MASETVIAHNVITSGQLPKHMGWTDEAYRDADNLLGKGAGAMHITGDLSLRRLRHADQRSYNGRATRSSPTTCTTAYPGTKFIVVGEKSYAVESATAPTRRHRVRLSSRSSSSLFDSLPHHAGRPRTGSRPARTCRPTSSDYCGRWYINSDAGNSYGTDDGVPVLDVPEDGNRFFPGTDALGAWPGTSAATPGSPTPRSR